MKCISFQDLLLATTLSSYRELDLLHPSMDDKVADVLKQCGVDINKPVLYTPCKHRTLRNKVVLGFVASGDLSLKDQYRHLFDVTERIAVAATTDIYLARDMIKMSHTPLITDVERVSDREEDPLDRVEEEDDYHEVLANIKQLEELRDSLRGSCFNESGGLKTYDEYAKDYETQHLDKGEV